MEEKLLEYPTLEQMEQEVDRLRYQKRYGRALRGTVYALIVVAAMAILVAVLWMPVLQITGVSMSPTLNDGDLVVAVKTSDYQTGDIAAFYYNNKILIKRVIASPGDWVDIDNAGNVYVNGALLEEPYLTEKSLGECNITLPYQVPDGRIFVMGDDTMQGSSLPIGGESTHAAITGHRGLPSSRLLTDLDQMAVGDTFVVYVLNEILTYEVDQIRIVEPEDMSNLAIEEGRDLCTLVTCTPYGVNSHRLLVRGHRVENAAGVSAVSARVTADAIQVDTLLVAPIVAIPILLSLLAVFLLRDKMIPAVQTDSIGEQETDETDENP